MSNIAIIGSGNMAAGLAAALTAAGKNVFIGARDAAKAQALAQKTGAQAQGGTLAQAVAAAQTVFLALPYAAAAFQAVCRVGVGRGRAAGSLKIRAASAGFFAKRRFFGYSCARFARYP